MKKHIPNLLTCCNLFTGCVAGVMVFRGHLDWAAYLIFAAAFFDLLDGLSARALEINSPYGKELDSLADVISFGFVPGAILFKLFQHAGLQALEPEPLRQFLQFVPFLVTVFSALRLAKFNTDRRQTHSFIGVPTPANTLCIASLPLIMIQYPGKFDHIILHPGFLLTFTLVMSLLLVSELPLFSLKVKSFSFRENKYQFVLIVVSLLLFFWLRFAAVPIIFLCYVFLSLLDHITGRPSEENTNNP
ncbi:MAG: CDP-alcohol phosphatidyltransferase family protein [Bacteroidia bacterium]|nr:CDP-alcohol phosphatidyltransferase family protein [Bacteroidia bacterium]